MRSHVAGTAVLLALVHAACTETRRAKPDPRVLMQADRAFARATAERRLEGFRSFLAEEVVTIRPDSPVIKGKDGLTARWAQLLTDPAMSIRWEPLDAVISDAGDMGFTVGSYEVTRSTGPDPQLAGSGKYVTVWRRETRGAWKVVFDSGVQDTPPK